MRQRAEFVAGSLGAVNVALVAAGALLLVSSGAEFGTFLAGILFAILLFAGVGALVAARRPDNAIGWLFSVIAFCVALSSAGQAYAQRTLIEAPGSLPAGLWTAWLSGWIGSVGFALILSFLPLLFPDGRPPSVRWRPVAWLALAMVVGFAAMPALLPGQLSGPNGPAPRFVGIENPLGLEVARPIAGALFWPSRAFGLVVIVLCTSSLVARYRVAGSATRQQLKWFAYAASALALVLVIGNVLQFVFAAAGTGTGSAPPPLVMGLWWGLVFPLAVGFLPVAAGIAVLRYRLYDVDILIRRTLIYGAVSVILAGTFFGLVLGIETLLRPLTNGSELAVAASTLAILALFQPVRGRIRTAVDRRFYRSRLDAARTIDEFTVRLLDEVDLDAVRTDLLRTAASAMQPVHAGLWLRAGGRHAIRTDGG